MAFIPGTPIIPLAPGTALALFLAPVIGDAAYDFPLGAARRFWGPLVALAGVGVLVTAGVVAFLAHRLLAVPWPAALALGAIVAPPDAAAATAVLSTTSIPRSTDAVLRGESLFNDPTALLLYGTALALLSSSSFTLTVGTRLLLAIPGGVLLGILCAMLLRTVNPFVKDTLGGNLFQFCAAYLVWLLADHLHLSAVLCTVAFAMTIARSAAITQNATRMRVQSFAVWSAVVFALNVFAFLLMGMQVRTILGRMQAGNLFAELRFSGAVVLAVVVTRFCIVLGFNRITSWRQRRRGEQESASLQQAVVVAWSGMRGFVTLATAFALPAAFPRRDTAVLTAFSVVLFTLVVQGLTLGPVIRLLRLDGTDATDRELAEARSGLAAVALSTLRKQSDPEAANLRFVYNLDRASALAGTEVPSFARYRRYGLVAISAERKELEKMRDRDQIGPALYLRLQEELDWRELTLLPEEDRQIEES